MIVSCDGVSIVLSVTVETSSQSHFATDGRSVSMSWYLAPSGAHVQMFVN
jgi:hypothetical protein